MKIVSWNVNGYRSITGQNKTKRYDEVKHQNYLFEFIKDLSVDIICLQETKCREADINEELKAPEGYYSYFSDCQIKKGYSGVAIISKLEAKSINRNIGIEEFDSEGRFLEVDFGEFIVYSIYFPSGTSGRDRIDYKLKFYNAVVDYIEQKRILGYKIIICGDYNTAHKEIDLARPKENVKNSGFLPEEREKFELFLNKGYFDTFRQFNSNPNQYTWWSMRGSAKSNNIGWRIDYILNTQNLKENTKDAKIYQNITGSDHCPITIDIDI